MKLFNRIWRSVLSTVWKLFKPKRWPCSVIPYTISDVFSQTEKDTIEAALKQIAGVSCFRFPKKTDAHRDWIGFVSLNGCWSCVGCIGGKQQISLSKAGVYEAVILHEVMHAIGFHHEHQRWDRDEHVEVFMDRFRWDELFEFVIFPDKRMVDFPYDIDSRMHYDGYAFSKKDSNGKRLPTIIDKKTGQPVPYNSKLSKLDIVKLNWIGNCSTSG